MPSPAPLPPALLGGRRYARRARVQPSQPEVHSTHTYAMPFSPPEGVDHSKVFFLSSCFEASAARKYRNVKLSIWTVDDIQSADLTIAPLTSKVNNEPAHAQLPQDLTNSVQDESTSANTCHLQFQLVVPDGSESISFEQIKYQEAPWQPHQKVLHEAVYPIERSGHGRCLLGYFEASRPMYKVFADGPSPPDSETNNNGSGGDVPRINHVSARLHLPDANRGEMPNLAPELLEEIFLMSVERMCDWPGCRIHTKQDLRQLAQVNSTWLAVAKRLHKTRESISKRLIESCSLWEYRHTVALPPALSDVADPRKYFSFAAVLEGLAASKFDGVNLTIALYGSDVPVPDMKVTYLGQDPQGPNAEVPADQSSPCGDRAMFPLHLRLDQWGASVEEITGYSLGVDQTWSSRVVWSGNIMFKGRNTSHLGWFKTSKPLCIDREADGSMLFGCRLSLPEPRRKHARKLPASILEKIFVASAQPEDDSLNEIIGGLNNFNGIGLPQLPPTWGWSHDLKRFAGVCKDWAHVAKKLQRFENTVASISGMTHASCMSFGDSVPQPNYIFAVSCVFEGRAASHFEGASLAICVPDQGAWSDVDIEYIGDTWDGSKVLDTMPPPSPRTPVQHGDDECSVDHPICPISLCLCTSQDDADAYHVSIRDFPSTKALSRRTINLENGKKQVFFGYFRSSRAFTGSASAAIPIHVVRVSLPSPGRKRFSPLPDQVMRRIAVGVTELSDSNRRTESWSENLRYMGMISRRFRDYASSVAWELAPEDSGINELSDENDEAADQLTAAA